MRRWTLASASALAILVAASATASAQNPARIFGALTGMVTAPLHLLPGMPRGFRGPRHVRRSVARQPARPAQAQAGRPTAAAASLPHLGWTGAVYWPHAADDMIDYVFFPKGDDRFWTYGQRDIVDAIVSPGPVYALQQRARLRRGQSLTASADPNGGDAAAAELCGSAQSAGTSNGWAERIEQAVEPTPAQREVLAQFRSALDKAQDDIMSACAATATTALERIDAMQDRLWAMQNAALTLRGPLENFYNSLSDEQKAALNGSGDRQAAPQSCDAQASIPEKRPGRLNKQQRQNDQMLQKAMDRTAQLLAGSCPTQAVTTPLARLDAEADRLGAMLYAVLSIRPAVDQFAQSRGARASGR